MTVLVRYAWVHDMYATYRRRRAPMCTWVLAYLAVAADRSDTSNIAVRSRNLEEQG